MAGEPVIVVFQLLGRKKIKKTWIKTEKRRASKGECKDDLVIQPMMERPKP